ncbi:hypothetical protein T484DRAFT_3630425 [Baffinella frigidus]|nr:hypothetical protein T484DRAFT_3630425 [Cryptophyta sp. CCMP2293]
MESALGEFTDGIPPERANNSIDAGSREFHCVGGKHNDCQNFNLATGRRGRTGLNNICAGCLQTSRAKFPTCGWVCPEHTTPGSMTPYSVYTRIFRCTQGFPTAYTTGGKNSDNPVPRTLGGDVEQGCRDTEPVSIVLAPVIPTGEEEYRIPMWFSALGKDDESGTFNTRLIYATYALAFCLVLPVNPDLAYEPLFVITTDTGVQWQSYDGSNRMWTGVKLGKNCKECHNLHYFHPNKDGASAPWHEYMTGAKAAFEKAQNTLKDKAWFHGAQELPMIKWCQRYPNRSDADRCKKREQSTSSDCEGSVTSETAKEDKAGWTQGSHPVHRKPHAPGKMWRREPPATGMELMPFLPQDAPLVRGFVQDSESDEEDEISDGESDSSKENAEVNSPEDESSSESESSSSDSEKSPTPVESSPSTALVVYTGVESGESESASAMLRGLGPPATAERSLPRGERGRLV